MAYNQIDLMRKFTRIRDGLTRRTVLILLIIFGLVLYLGPSVFRWLRVKTPIMIDANIGCVAQYMDPYVKKAASYDATYHISYGPSPTFLPYVGNGKLAVPLRGAETFLHVKHSRSLSLKTDFNPLVQVRWKDYSHQEGTAVDFTSGLGYNFICYNKKRRFFTVKQEFVADRSYPSLLVQKIDFFNDMKEDIEISLFQDKPPNTRSISMNFEDGSKYRMYSSKVPVTGNLQLAVAIAFTELPLSLLLEAESSKTIYVRTIISYDLPSSNPSQLQTNAKNAESNIISMLKKLHSVSADYQDMKSRHIQTWNQIWRSGFGISHSKAQGSLNGDKINATLYMVLANSRVYNLEADAVNPTAVMSYPDRCYDGHHTLQASTLWSDLDSISSINRIVALWLLTLEKQSCQNLVNSGAEGVMQAMILSFGAFKFRSQHLEFHTHPDDLHRDLFFRRIHYGNTSRLNVSVIVGGDNKAVIYAAMDLQDRDFFACDGGCLDPPVKLGPGEIQFPVKLTDPVTSILYITPDREHIEYLKHTIHVKEVAEAPAHQHHVLALHRHGHQLGGLPAVFWVSIAFLIIVFHLFLAKLIYNEYCTNPQEKVGYRRRHLV